MLLEGKKNHYKSFQKLIVLFIETDTKAEKN